MNVVRAMRTLAAAAGHRSVHPTESPSTVDVADSDSPAFLDRPMTSFYLVLGVGGALLSIGLVMVLSASSVESMVDSGSAYALFRRQVVWVGVGLLAVWLGVALRPSVYRKIAGPMMVLSLLMLIAVIIPGVGVEYYGARRWFDFGPLHLQPSELAKLAFVLWGADLLVRKQKLIREWRHLLVPIAPGMVALSGLVMLEPDLGTTLCFVLVFFALLWTVGAPLRLFVGLFGAAVSVIVVLIAIEPYRLARITSYLNPWADPEDTGHQAIQGMYALGTGGWFGVGLGNSRTKWGDLPNSHSDFIFAIIGEELGFVGCMVVLGMFAALAYSGIRIARRTSDPFIRLAASAITVWLVGQAAINIGYVVGLLPVTGIPLPLISSGGTSLVLTMFIVGMLASFARHEPDAVAHLQRRGQGRIARLMLLPIPRAAVDAPPKLRRVPPPRRPAARRPSGTGQAPKGRAR